MGFEFQPFGRQVSARAAAHEQAGAHGRFQRCDAARDGGLGDAQAFRRAVEAAGFDQVEEGFELFDLHGAA